MPDGPVDRYDEIAREWLDQNAPPQVWYDIDTRETVEGSLAALLRSTVREIAEKDAAELAALREYWDAERARSAAWLACKMRFGLCEDMELEMRLNRAEKAVEDARRVVEGEDA